MTSNNYVTPESNVNGLGTADLSLSEVLFSFKGRIGRKPYWLFFLAFMVAMFVVVGVLAAIGMSETSMSIIAVLLYIPAIWMSLAIQVKRWHDRDKSGWWVLISFIPIIGPIWALIENGFLAGNDGENRFGMPSA